jgi:gas vesicle protein GvpL/GvpF
MSATAASPTDAPTTEAAYVYGVVARGSVAGLGHQGVGGAPVRTVEHGELAALVSLIQSDRLRVRRRDLVNHLRVLEEAFEVGTIVPCAFGTVLPSEEAVRHNLLDARRDELLGALRRLEGLVQLNVRVLYDEDELLREVVSNEPEVVRLRDQTRKLGDAGYYERIKLGELVAAAVAARREHDADKLYHRLAHLAADVVPDEPGEGVALKASFLVERRALGAFDRELDAIAREHGKRLVVESIGPLPPTAFAGTEER